MLGMNSTVPVVKSSFPLTKNRMRVAFLGDSMTAGSRDTSTQSTGQFPRELFAASGGQFVPASFPVLPSYSGVLAAGGKTTEQIYNEQLSSALDSNADVVCIMSGTNDIGSSGWYQADGFAKTTGYLKSMGEQIQDSGKIPCLINLIPGSSKHPSTVARFNRFLACLAETHGWYFCDVSSGMIDATTGQVLAGYTADGTHLTQDTAELVGANLLSTLRGENSAWIDGVLVQSVFDVYSAGMVGLNEVPNGLFMNTGLTEDLSGWSLTDGTNSTLTSTPDLKGRKGVFARTGSGMDLTLYRNFNFQSEYLDGDEYWIACKLNLSVETTESRLSVYTMDVPAYQPNTNAVYELYADQVSVPLLIKAKSRDGSTSARMMIRLESRGVGSVGGSVELSQLTAFNYSALMRETGA